MCEYILFKFRVINKYLIDCLENGTIYFAHPSRLNDPFDCRVDIKKAADHAISNLSGEKKQNLSNLLKLRGLLDRIQKDTGNVGICSFSLILEDTLLWSHYADEHRGLCLMYEIPDEFINDPKNKIIGVSAVEYGHNPLTDWFIRNAPEKNNIDLLEFAVELIKKVFSIKSRAWEYEKEVRIIREKEGVFSLPKGFLKQVCFGMNTPEPDISSIRKLIDDTGYSVNYCRIKRTKDDFGIGVVEI